MNRLTYERMVNLARWGYYRIHGIDPEHASDVTSLGPDHQFHKDAVRQYQEFFRMSIGPQCYGVHGREFQLSEDVGPITAFEMDKPRCGFPDILPANAEQANWPNSCRMDLTMSFPEGTTFRGMAEQQVIDGTNRALLNVIEDFEINIRLDRSKYPNTNINFKPARLGGSVLADQYLATNRCDYTSNGRMDNDRNWEYWYWVTVRSHEDGHAYGMPHNGDPSALLYPSINRASVSRRGKMNQTDKRTMRGLGYKERTSPPPDDPAVSTIVAELDFDDGFAIRVVGDWPKNGKYIATGAKK